MNRGKVVLTPVAAIHRLMWRIILVGELPFVVLPHHRLDIIGRIFHFVAFD